MSNADVSLKSVATTFAILEIVADYKGPAPLKLISERAKISPSKAHRYVQSLCAVGLLDQTRRSGAYDLGINALRLGMLAISRVKAINRASDALGSLVDELKCDAFLSVWSDSGPVIVRVESSGRPGLAMTGPGTTLPLLTTSVGHVFLAYANPRTLKSVIIREAEADPSLTEKSVESIVDGYSSVRTRGYAVTEGYMMRGRCSAAAPILSLHDRIVAAVSFVSFDRASVDPDSREIRRLLDFANRYSVSTNTASEETAIERKMVV